MFFLLMHGGHLTWVTVVVAVLMIGLRFALRYRRRGRRGSGGGPFSR